MFINSLKLLRCGLGEGAFEGYSLCQLPPPLKQNRIVFLMEGGSRTSARGVQYAEILLAHTSPFKTQDWRRELAPWKQIKVGLCIFLPYTCREVVQKEEGKRSLLSLMTRIMWVFCCCCYYFLDAPCQRAPSLTCLQE